MGLAWEKFKDRFTTVRRVLNTPGVWQKYATFGAAGLLMVSFVGLAVFASTCSNRAPAKFKEQTEVIVYTSADGPLSEAVVKAFEQATGITVKLVTDTEATKTFGLVQRLADEKEKPKADVWWSSEVLGSVRLAREQVVEPNLSKEDVSMPGGWPAHLKAADGAWYAFAKRARVIAFNPTTVNKNEAPRTLRELADPKWGGRVGMARPSFGTTRTQLAALCALHGVEPVRAWLAAMRDNRVKLYNGNAAVVEGMSRGEIDVGLTDTDDVWAGQANGWPVDFVFEMPDRESVKPEGLPSVGPIVIPHTAAKVRGGPNPRAARLFIDFLLSEDAEKIAADSPLRAIPVRAKLADTYQQWWIPKPPPKPPVEGMPPMPEPPPPWEAIDWARAAGFEPTVVRLSQEILGP